jgi:predicted CopG family antitoxin
MNQLNEIHKVKTVVMSEQTYNKIKQYGKMGDSFDDVISRLLDQVKENER